MIANGNFRIVGMCKFRSQIGEKEARIPKIDLVGREQMRREAGHATSLHRAGRQPQGMPRRDNCGRGTAGDRDAAKRQNRFPKLLPIKIAGRVLRERTQQRSIVFGLLQKRRIATPCFRQPSRAAP